MKAFIPSKLAEIIFALVFAYFSYLHFTNAEGMGGMVPDYMPGGGKIWVYITGGGFLLAAIAIISGSAKTLACYLLAAVLLIFDFTIHIPGIMNAADAMAEGMATSGLLKDTGLAMGAIVIGNRK